MRYALLHLCQLADPAALQSHLLLLDPADALVLCGASLDWLDNALLSRLQAACASVYVLADTNDAGAPCIDVDGLVRLMEQAERVYGWK